MYVNLCILIIGSDDYHHEQKKNDENINVLYNGLSINLLIDIYNVHDFYCLIILILKDIKKLHSVKIS